MLRVFGDSLGDEPTGSSHPGLDPDGVEQFSPSWVRAARPYNEDHFATASRERALRMMSNESPYAPSARVVEAVVEAMMRGNQYPGTTRDLAARLSERAELEVGSTLLGAGSTELIDVVIRTFVGPGEEVLIGVPTFSMYEARTRTVGGIPVLVPMTDDHEYDIPALIRAVTERTKVIFVCSPNNPTGNRIPEADLKRLLRLGLPTVIDEAYFDLGEGGSYAHLIQEFPNAIVLRTFSKAFGLAGIRIGYALAHPSVIKLLDRVKVPWNLSSLTIAAAMAALEDEAGYRERVGELTRARAELVTKIARIPGLVPVSGDGNFVLIDISATRATAEDFVRAVLGDGILIRSLSVHHANRSYVRVTVGTPEQNERCLAALARVAGKLGRERSRFVALSDAE
jgi:histidinol-phosphate aminotransferase